MIQISNKSNLILDGAEIFIKSLTLDGTLYIKTCKHCQVYINDLIVNNETWPLIQTKERKNKKKNMKSSKYSTEILLRGYEIKRNNQQFQIIYNKPGVYELFNVNQIGTPYELSD